MKKTIGILLAVLFLLSSFPLTLFAEDEAITVLFTHDVHDYLYPTETVEGGERFCHGGIARLKTLIDRYSDENTVYLDAGDFSMGTLYQAAYATDAYELRCLGACGCAVTTFGNHEFDYGADGAAKMLRAAMASGDPLPAFVQSNIDLSGELTDEQKELKQAMEEYGVRDYTILERGGKKIGLFGLCGYDCIECIQTDLSYIDYIEAAKSTVEKLKAEQCDLIIALSHSGTEGDGENGEDIELAKAVPEIGLIISGHSHSSYAKPVTVGNTVIVSAGEYLRYLGKITFTVSDGVLNVTDYALIPIDDTVPEDAQMQKRIAEYKEAINASYLDDMDMAFDDVICHSDYDMIGLGEMYATHNEYTVGNLIADSYLYEAQRCGIDDIDVALVGLGTIRGSVKKGDITVADAFEICSLGVGADGSAGHPIVSAYITGEELKLLTELDASLGPLVSSVKMSYAGLSYTFNEKRIILDRVTDVHLVQKSGISRPIEDDRLYRVCANMYAINMLGMLNGLTKGILKITPKAKDGTPIEDFYAYSLKNEDGAEIKEWVAFAHYLASFEKNENGIPELPASYASLLGRKVKTSVGGFAAIKDPGTATKIMPTLLTTVFVILVLIITLIILIKRYKKSRRGKRHSEL